MISYILRRLASMIPVLILVSMITFALVYILPGDPALAIIGERDVGSEVYRALRKEMGLDDPVYLQYAHWLGRIVRGDFGTSTVTKLPVAKLLGDKILVSLNVGLAGMLVSLLIGVPMALLAAVKRGRFVDTLATVIAVFGVAIPGFWLAVLLMYLFGVQLRILPVSGYVTFAENPLMHMKLLVMPALSLGFRSAATIMRQGRASLIQALKQDYVTTARSKGIGERAVVFRHAVKNAMTPVVTILGMELGTIIAGAAVTETVFAIPGVGMMAVDAIFYRDFLVLQAAVIVLTLTAIAGNLLADIAYAALDPRVRYR